MKSNFELMAAYNQSMNQRLFESASVLSLSELEKDRRAFFRSIMGTINHILVGDTIWLKRFADHNTGFNSLEYVRNLPSPTTLDETLYSTFWPLQEARSKMDKVFLDFTSEITESDLSGVLEYKNTKGLHFAKNFGQILQHVFNHQTHHRGQVTTLLTQVGVDVGVTDLLLLIPDEKV